MSGDGDGGLGGTVVMTGAPDITEEAAMCALSWSILGLDGSSEDRRKEEEFSYRAKKTLSRPSKLSNHHKAPQACQASDFCTCSGAVRGARERRPALEANITEARQEVIKDFGVKSSYAALHKSVAARENAKSFSAISA